MARSIHPSQTGKWKILKSRRLRLSTAINESEHAVEEHTNQEDALSNKCCNLEW